MTDEKLDEIILKLSGSLSLLQKLKTDHDYDLSLVVNVYAIEKRSNQNGSYDLVFKAKPTGQGEIKTDKGEKIIAPVRGESLSKKMRNAIFTCGEDYDIIMPKMIANLDNLIEYLSKL